MDEHAARKQHENEDFSGIYSWTDSPNAFYPDHTHAGITAHIVLKGEITVTSQGKAITYRNGDRFDVPANTVHSAQAGPDGCTYVVGEKHK